MERNYKLLTLIGIITIAVFSRLIPHPPNFTPLDAIAIFSGAYLGRKWFSFVVPLLILFISDIFLGFYSTIPFVYGAFLINVWVGILILSKKRNFVRILSSSLLSSIIFFIVSNFGVWRLENLYSKDIMGLVNCYIAAIPFLKNTAYAGIIYSFFIFSLFGLLEKWALNLREKKHACHAIKSARTD